MLRHPVLISLAAIGALVCTFLLASKLRFGSVSNAFAYLNGQYVKIDEPARDLGRVTCRENRQVEFVVMNLRDEELKLAGASCSCSCVAPPKMPILLPPHESTSVVFDFTSPPTPMEFVETIELYYDGPIEPTTLKIVGTAQ